MDRRPRHGRRAVETPHPHGGTGTALNQGSPPTGLDASSAPVQKRTAVRTRTSLSPLPALSARRVPSSPNTASGVSCHRIPVRTVRVPPSPSVNPAYLRVSTARQDAGSQRLAILEYARREGLRIDDFIEATASTRTNAKRRRLDQLMAALESGDRLVVSELSRLGRSLGEVVAMLDTVAKAGVIFVAIKENIRFEGRQDLQTKVMTTLFALFADVERDLISERIREGLAKARASGKKLGRPKGSLGVSRLDGREDEIRHFLTLWRIEELNCQDHGRHQDDPLQLHRHTRAQRRP